MSEIEVLVPVAEPRIAALPLAARVARLEGATVGWFDNRKANADALLTALGDAFAAQGIDLVHARASKNATAAAPDSIMAHLESCDAVVLAIAD